MPGNNPSDLAGKPPEDRRKLITVMYADMVGYSRLIGLDNDAGNPPAAAGHIVQTGGDPCSSCSTASTVRSAAVSRFSNRFRSMTVMSHRAGHQPSGIK